MKGFVSIFMGTVYCGDVLTRKTFTEDYRTHRTLKNRGDRPQSRYLNHHEAIISRDDFIAVQRMLDNAKYKNKSILPELRVIESGILKGFVSVNPRWSGFKVEDYYRASQSVYTTGSKEQEPSSEDEMTIEVAAGDFDFRGFEIARSELFDSSNRPYVLFSDKKMKFSTTCVRKFGAQNIVELLVNPVERRLAIRPTEKTNRNNIIWSKPSELIYYPREISTAAFSNTLFQMMGWNTSCKYRIQGSLYKKDSEMAYIFDVRDSEVFFNSSFLPYKLEDEENSSIEPIAKSGKMIRAIPENWTANFGKPFYLHEQSISALEAQSEQDWKLRLQGQLFETGRKIKVTGFEELRSYIKQELSTVTTLEAKDE